MTELKLSQAVLDRRVWNQAIYQQHCANFMLGQTAQYIGEGSTAIDVGAAVGMYSYFFSQYAGTVWSYEAVKPVYQQLLKTAGRTMNIHPINKAVGNYVGTAKFWVDDKRLSNSGFQNLVDGQQITVPITMLDAEFNDSPIEDISFIKIDVEGSELAVLQGAEGLITRQRPTLMVEIYPKFAADPVESIFAWCFDRGYRCMYNHKGQGLRPVPTVENGVDAATNLVHITDGDFLFVFGVGDT